MNELKQIAELEINCKTNIDQLRELFKAYELAKIGYDMQEQQIKDLENTVLNDNCFYANEGCERANINAGERITDESFSFLLSDEDFNKFQAMKLPILVQEGITDEKGNYITNWLTIKCDAYRCLVNYIVDNIIPEEFREVFSRAKLNITYTDKLINIIRPIVITA
jgi:hypothetical protein